MKVLRFTCSVTLWLVMVCCSLFLSGQRAQAQKLWLGNDTVGNVFQTDTAGNVITNLPSLPVTGIAWDGNNLYFADRDGNFTKRTADGSTVLSSFVISSGDTGEDLAWDIKRKHLWRIVHNPPVLQEIDPAASCGEGGGTCPTLVNSYPLPTFDDSEGGLGAIGGLGIAYDAGRDKLYVSFCSVGCGPPGGLVDTVDPSTGTDLGPLFHTTGFYTGGLGYDPDTDTLWVGDFTTVRHMSLSGNVLSTFSRPTPGGFVDGLEFVPHSQSAVITAGGQGATLNFNGGTGNNAYDYTAKLLPGGLASVLVKVQPIPIDEEACEQLVQKSFPHTQCFVFQNADGQGNSKAVLFELTCPGLSDDSCDTSSFFADLGTEYTFQKSDNPGFQLLNSTIGPYAGWLKGNGGVLGHPCTPNPNGLTPLFQSNQISSFKVTGDPTGVITGHSKPGGSCWVGTYGTSGEAPPGVKITDPKFTVYTQNSPNTAHYTCSDPKTSKTGSVGPYLTAASCTQSQAPNLNNGSSCSANNGGVITCSGTFDVSVKGFHVFQVKAVDTGGNVGVNFVFYSVR